MRNAELWARLQAYTFDGPGSAPFSAKLGRAEGWSPAFTGRVIEEYRRFLYLTQVSSRQVTPSQIVDAAWHMHLTFTRDYWEVLCPKVIGAPIHHQPCAGEEEMPRYRDQFAATKALYVAEFGAEPPGDIWGHDRASSRPLRRLAVSEAGMTSPAMIAFIPFAISLVLAVIQQEWLPIGLAVITGALFFMVLLNPNRRRKSGRGRTGRDDDTWIDFEGDVDTPSSRRSGSDETDSKNSTSTSTGSAGSGGFLAGFFGGGDSDGGDDGGGCGGCGD